MTYNNQTILSSEFEKIVLKFGKIIIKNRKKILNQFDLSFTQFEILTAIFDSSNKGEDLIQIRLSDITLIDAMTVSTVLRCLQKKGLVKRERDEINTRILKITLSEQGELIYNQIICELEKVRINFHKGFDKILLLKLRLKLEQSLSKYYFI
ncbi:MarR family transcriptional regulator [Dysgonomonas mossii]|uniref:HTH-type transcriptional regulator SarZ n=1 Tax=Dysgonomonas mossii TaxID=163665 RepID=A0A4Y9IJX4_9BACT|nr:MarR family transcriptional regulator [Dysgonomonas mossii]MBF0762026.1 MarR family transcriptional regulator [Dysgonomonas mossii]TFU88847.1 MarR family transcriptional regulator [Dysgonomonas mossii]